MNNSTSQRVLAGIRASGGQLHLGNYLGAIKGMLELQANPDYETLYMVADGHAVTTPYDPAQLHQQRHEIILDYLAAGLDPQKSILFCQSDVAAHFELAFYLSSVTTVAKMQHLPTFKDKVKQYPQNVNLALLNYPVLMAADILVYQANLVPVGVDQEPHIEVAREIARRMNQDFKLNFPEPQRFVTPGGYIPSLTGEGKMSKSVEGSYINLTDDLDTIVRKVRQVPTASDVGGEMPAGVKVLFEFAKLYLPSQVADFEAQFQAGTLRYVQLKDAIAQAIFADLQPFQQKRAQLVEQPEYVDQVRAQGAEKAAKIANQTVLEVRRAMGLA